MVKFAGLYNELTNTTPLPHKTIALLAGLWWIGKHNLLVTPEFGSAISLYTVLTDAPVKTVLHPPARSLFGERSICRNICSPGALTGRAWDISTSKDERLDVSKCTGFISEDQPGMIVGDDIKDYYARIAEGPEAALRHLVKELIDYVESAEYVNYAESHD